MADNVEAAVTVLGPPVWAVTLKAVGCTNPVGCVGFCPVHPVVTADKTSAHTLVAPTPFLLMWLLLLSEMVDALG